MPGRFAAHPKAYLKSRKNVRRGLISRTKILVALEKGEKTVQLIASEAGLTYSCVLYHLKGLSRDRLVARGRARRMARWSLTPFGQQRLVT